MRNTCLILILVFLKFNCSAQETKLENLIPITTALKEIISFKFRERRKDNDEYSPCKNPAPTLRFLY